MTQTEYIEKIGALHQERRELTRSNGVQMSLIEADHRDRLRAEAERYENAKRKQQAEYYTKADELSRREMEIKRQRSLTREEEEKALIAAGVKES